MVTKRPEVLEDKLKRYVKFGFSVPVWASSLLDIPVTMIQACGLMIQHKLKGIKYRLTYGLYFSITGNDTSVNSKYDMNACPEIFYGLCHTRIMYFVVALRLRFPNEKMLISKYDFVDAY